ncbi:MAG: energy transducer TonB [Flavobacteriales bacterium]
MTVIYVIVALVTGFSLFDFYVNKNWEAITSVNRNEAVFAHRNREYGAYVLRSGYNKRMSLIMAGLVALAALGFVANLIIKNLPKEEVAKPKISEKNFTIAPPKEDVPPPPPPPETPPPPMTATQAFIAPVAEDDPVEDEMPTQQQLENIAISTETNDGEDSWEINITEDGPALQDTPNTAPEEVVDVAEEDAEFPGGYDKLALFIQENLVFPEEAYEIDVKGKVTVRFVVEKDGRISNATVERPIVECPACNKEALNVVNKMPKWVPAKNAGRAVRLWVRIPVVFDAQ